MQIKRNLKFFLCRWENPEAETFSDNENSSDGEADVLLLQQKNRAAYNTIKMIRSRNEIYTYCPICIYINLFLESGGGDRKDEPPEKRIKEIKVCATHQ